MERSRIPYKQEVDGSIPSPPTISSNDLQDDNVSKQIGAGGGGRTHMPSEGRGILSPNQRFVQTRLELQVAEIKGWTAAPNYPELPHDGHTFGHTYGQTVELRLATTCVTGCL
jgi:hypothetical protein